MAEVTKKNLVLGFKTAAGKEVKITITAPRENLSAEEINAVMSEIIAADALGEAELVREKSGAKYVIQEVEAINVE